jgi:hypothetical protein
MLRRALATLFACLIPAAVLAEDPPLTRDVPIEEFQNQHEERRYDFNATPEGMFRSIEFAEGFEEELGFRRTHEIVPVGTTDTFRPDAPVVYVVFRLFQHMESFQIYGICYPESVDGLSPQKPIAQDAMYIALEDDSGYLKLQAPEHGWKPGRYKVLIHAGWEVNDVTLFGTMRFTVKPR